MTRPCHCDRFHPGRPYVAGRDCPKCWMFAYRPAVRKAWGGDPADCAAHFAARPDMPAAALAELLEGLPLLMPDGWRSWPVTREAHRLLADRFLARLPPYPPGRYAGRGAVICGGGDYEPGAYVACRMLRLVGWSHPIQVWHRGPHEPVSARLRRLPGVEIVDAEAHPDRSRRRILGGWEAKVFAILNCPFEDVLFLDADCYPIYDPGECFQPAHNPHGIVTWPDHPTADHTPQWQSYGLTPDGKTSLNGGHYVLTKRKAWAVLQLAQHYDDHSDYYYCQTLLCVGDVGGYGDQDQLRVALHRLAIPSHRYAERPLLCDHNSYVQAGPHGRPLFVHRHFNKFAAQGCFLIPPHWSPGHLPMEATAWRFFLEWLTEPADDEGFPAEVPGSLSQADCALWSQACQGRDVLVLGRHQARSTVVAALAGRKVVAISHDSVWEADFWLQRYGARHKAWLREGPVADLAPSSGGPFSACLIDGNHDRESLERDLAAVLPLLSPGGLIALATSGDPAAREHGWSLLRQADSLLLFQSGPAPEPG